MSLLRRLGFHAAPIALALAPLLLALVAWLVLRPGIGGTFLLDDFPNLTPLENVSLTNWEQGDLARFLGSSIPGPTGRPVAMLSFLPHEAHWPWNARPFLRTSLLLHCLIGVLVLGLARRLALLAGIRGERRATLFGVVVATLWLLHPLQASTVFYAVQRMAQLSALFSIAAIYSYVVGRQHLVAGRPAPGWSAIALTPLLAVIGTYAKENAVLVPVALLLVEYWFFRDRGTRSRDIRILRTGFLWLPTAVIATYLVYKIGADGYLARDFTAAQRLMTQPRILVDYLRLLLQPAHVTGGLFNDNYNVSTSLWQPVSTIFSLAVCIALIALSFVYRQRYPLASWGMAFFFAMHLLESSTIPLELYYEHRNYLPSIGVMTTLSALGFGIYGYRRYIGVLALTAMIGSVATIGHLRAQNWGHPLRQAELWTQTNPASPRAWQNLALRNHEYGYRSGARYALSRWQALRPEAILPSLSLLAYECPDEPVARKHWSDLRDLARNGEFSHGLLVALNQLVNQSVNGDCRGLRPDEVHVLLRSLLDNPKVRSPFVRQRLWHLDGQLLLAPGFLTDAMAAFRNSHSYLRDPEMRMVQARYLANRGHEQEALSLLAAAEHAPEESIYGRLHVYWLVHEPGRIEALAREIRSGDDAEPDARQATATARITTDNHGSARTADPAPRRSSSPAALDGSG